MAEYIISDKQYTKLIFAAGNHDYNIMDDVEEELENNEIVRCKDCKHWDTSHREPWVECSDKRACINLSFIHSDYPALSNFAYTDPDGFCSCGERRAD